MSRRFAGRPRRRSAQASSLQGGELALNGFNLSRDRVPAGETFDIDLAWTAVAPPAVDYQSEITLIGPGGLAWSEKGTERPRVFEDAPAHPPWSPGEWGWDSREVPHAQRHTARLLRRCRDAVRQGHAGPGNAGRHGLWSGCRTTAVIGKPRSPTPTRRQPLHRNIGRIRFPGFRDCACSVTIRIGPRRRRATCSADTLLGVRRPCVVRTIRPAAGG